MTAKKSSGLGLIVFDVAGTTICDDDNAVARCVQEALQQAGVEIPLTAVNPVMGMPKPLAIRMLLADARGQTPQDAEAVAVHAEFQRRIVAHYAEAPNVRPMPGAPELFEELRQRDIRIGLDTGFDRKTLDTILRRLDWTDAVDATITSDEVAQGRPDPEMIHALMRRLGVTSSAAVGKVGDSVSDIEEGLAAGCGLVVGILGERTRGADLKYPGVRMISSLDQLLPMIDEAALEPAE